MIRIVLALGFVSGCSALHNVSHHRPPIAAGLVDVALFSASSCIGLDAQFRTHDTAQGFVGYGVAALTWASFFVPETR